MMQQQEDRSSAGIPGITENHLRPQTPDPRDRIAFSEIIINFRLTKEAKHTHRQPNDQITNRPSLHHLSSASLFLVNLISRSECKWQIKRRGPKVKSPKRKKSGSKKKKEKNEKLLTSF
jgi:hypothetical protein